MASALNRLLGRRKSAGVVVTAEVHDLISQANAARGLKNWPTAATGYAAALEQAPELRHIWIQLGHAHKEAGDYTSAGVAYERAEALDAADGEPAVYLGELARLEHRGQDSMAHYLRAFDLNPGNTEAFEALHRMMGRKAGFSKETIMQMLRGKGVQADERPQARKATRGREAETLAEVIANATALGLSAEQLAVLQSTQALLVRDRSAAPATTPDGRSAVVFDASDLLSYFRNARLPTGIQRVQIATISSAVNDGSFGEVRICNFSDEGNSWTEVPADEFLDICELAVLSGDRTEPTWLAALAQLQMTLSVAPAFEFPDGAFLVNLGTSWWLQNYFLFVREAKRLHNVKYVPFVHDFIPVMTPEHCVIELTRDFISWALGAFQHADFFLVNSEATKRDLIKVAERLGHSVDASAIATIPLDADFRNPDSKPVPFDDLRQWRLKQGEFVLIVSTIESRKNHIGALDAWAELIEQHGARRIPKLVCVGNRGWLNDAVYARIESNPALRDKVVMLSGLSDAELALLYRACRFTLYPSNYEGWGLPVTESLCYGKVPLVSDASSLPEAGGPFAVYFTAGSTPELKKAAERLIFDTAELTRREAAIVANFKPRTWQQIAVQIASEVRGFADRGGETDTAVAGAAVPEIVLGAYYPITRNFETRIWRGLSSAEVFRSGLGWWWPDDWGCWTRPEGGEISLKLPKDTGAVRGYIMLHAPDETTAFTVQIDVADMVLSGSLRPGEFRWLPIDIPATRGSDDIVISLLGSTALDLSDRTGGLDTRVISVGVGGFYFCRQDDAVARANFVEAVAFQALDQLAFNREDTRLTGGFATLPEAWKQPEVTGNGSAAPITPVAAQGIEAVQGIEPAHATTPAAASTQASKQSATPARRRTSGAAVKPPAE